MSAADLKTAYAGRVVCVTGGAGFIGSHLVDALLQHGANVRVLDDFSTGREENLAEVVDQLTIVRGSILDAAAVEQAVSGVATVFHLAAQTSVPRSVEEPEHCMEVNVTGTLRVLEAARRAGVQRVVFAASSSAYGEQGGDKKIETVRPDPQSPYAVAKCTGEQLLIAYAHCYGLDSISLRYFNIYGPRQRPDSPYAAVLPKFAESMLAGRRPLIFGDGSQTRDFTHVSNAVHANLLAGASEKQFKGAIVNIACGRSYSVLYLLEQMAEQLGVEAVAEFSPPRVGEILHSGADITLARELLGYEPVTSFEDGLRATVESYRRSLGGS